MHPAGTARCGTSFLMPLSIEEAIKEVPWTGGSDFVVLGSITGFGERVQHNDRLTAQLTLA